jgi:hypothetical protein
VGRARAGCAAPRLARSTAARGRAATDSIASRHAPPRSRPRAERWSRQPRKDTARRWCGHGADRAPIEGAESCTGRARPHVCCAPALRLPAATAASPAAAAARGSRIPRGVGSYAGDVNAIFHGLHKPNGAPPETARRAALRVLPPATSAQVPGRRRRGHQAGGLSCNWPRASAESSCASIAAE